MKYVLRDCSNLLINHKAIDLLIKNKDKLIWVWVSKNSEAIEILNKNKDKINWKNLSLNPSIFIINPRCLLEYKLTRSEIREFAFEHPRVYLTLKSFVDRISQCVYDPSYKWCQRRLLDEFNILRG